MAEPRWSLCPRCGSFDIHGDHLTPLGQRYKCKDCGYAGSFVVEAEAREDAERIRAEIQADHERSMDSSVDDEGEAQGP